MDSNRPVSRRAVLGGAAIAGAGVLSNGIAFADSTSAPIDDRSVDAVAGRLDADLIALRRDIHAHPELSGQEQRTAALVAARLRDAGLDVTTGVGGHGIVGLLHGTRPGRTVAYRADMDAVPPGDQIGGGPEAAHVCGHDIHTAVGVGVAEVLARLRHRLSGTVVFAFQPGEETLTGAAAMLSDGVFARARPAEIHALHCGPFPVGEFAVTGGYGLPGLDRGTITLTGPDAAVNARGLADEIAALGTVSPPSTPAELEQLVADVEAPHSPLAEFVYLRAQASDNQVLVSYRCWPQERYVGLRAEITRLSRAHGADVTFPAAPFPAMVCPEREGAAVRRFLLRRARVTPLHAAIPFSGEDFSLFLDRMPGTFTFLGVRSPGAGIETSYPHFGTFAPDERSIGHGVRAMAGWLAERTRR
ncbi:M20 metallopeptidase family protein [Actinophytocola oryzae]|uniref:Amidohydrolase n=1 Tax=Actinophytocola oryzae TaxID=502181 RepID=A0A4V3FSV3_9PSEU|nr:M20/M25/M40 family metallo-hydrolase [Actinophytocola oryzae]TDV48851.1 amidohydrolase [Actinophytocola oryzae]